MSEIDWTMWSAIAGIVSSITIVATLIYLALQTKQNAAAILANSRNAMLAGDIAVLQQLVENPSIVVSPYKKNHTPEDLIRSENWLIALVRTREHQWFQYRDGLVDEKVWHSYLSAIPYVMSFPIQRAWWNFVKHDYFDREFVDHIDEVLSDTPTAGDLRPTIERAIEAADS